MTAKKITKKTAKKTAKKNLTPKIKLEEELIVKDDALEKVEKDISEPGTQSEPKEQPRFVPKIDEKVETPRIQLGRNGKTTVKRW